MTIQVLGLILLIAATGAIFVLLPVAADAHSRFQNLRPVKCPETGQETTILMDAGRAARTALFGDPKLRVKDCGNWPARLGCEQKCLEKTG